MRQRSTAPLLKATRVQPGFPMIRTPIVRRSGFALFLLLLLAGSLPAHAQELNCRVTVDIRQLAGTEYTYLRTDLAEQIETYLNTQPWTDDTFLDEERIDCTVEVVFLEAVGMNDFRAQLTIFSRRPIYGTTDQVQVLRHSDSNWAFSYVQNQPLQRVLERYDPLTSVLDFYAFLIVGYDYDTFGEFGGTRHFEQAQRVASLGEASGAAGWSGIGQESSRGNFVQQLLDPNLRPLRKVYFDYHFGGLDHFLRDTERARTVVLNALEQLKTLYQRENRRPYVMNVFLSAKADELVAMFQGSPYARQVFDLLMQVDPSRSETYNRLQG